MKARNRDHLWLLLMQMVAIGLVMSGSSATSGFPLDDAWIHQVIARTFAETGTLGFTPGMHGAAATSFTWAALMALNPLLLGISSPLFALLVNVPLYLATGQFVLSLLLADGIDRRCAWFGAAFFSLAGNWMWFALSGMEATLAAFLAVCAVWCWRHPSGGKRTDWCAGIACAVLFLTRPESALLLLVLAAPLARTFRRDWPRLVSLGVPLMIAVSAYACSNLLLTGHVSPSTLAGRKWMWLLAEDGLGRLDMGWRMVLAWADRLSEFTLGCASPFWFWPLAGIAGFGLITIVRERRARVLTLVGWACTHFGVFFFLLPTEGHGGRYQPLVPPLFAMLVAVGVLTLARSPRKQVAALTLVAIPFLLCLKTWSRAHALAIQHINTTELGMGRLVSRLPPDARIASFDMGGIAYIAGRPVTDLGGLVDPGVIDFIANGRTEDLLRRERIEYVVLPVGYGPSFPDPWNYGELLLLFDSPRLKLTLIGETISPLDVWRPGLRATLHSAPRQMLFRVEYL